jgi:A/G-specific adenine glycosylase
MARRKREGGTTENAKPAVGGSLGAEAEGEAPDRDPAWVERVRRGLLDWYGEAGRELPWRADRDAYRILVSEFMLVQTTVAAVIPYFDRFLRRFPDARSLAEADEEDVLKAWEGLGYYRRAKQLQAAAREVVQHHGGTIPDDVSAVRDLPGVGPYIAGAVLSLAFDRPEPIVEANSQRVLARLVALDDDMKSAAARQRVWQVAGRLVPPRRAGDFNQALMDLGAMICTVRQPRCLLCPMAEFCQARRRGLQEVIPRITPKPPPTAVTEACAVVYRQGRVLIVQRALGGLWERFWEFPTIHVAGPDPAGRSFESAVTLAEGVRRLTGIVADIAPPSSTIRYGVTNYRVTLEVSRGEGRSGTVKPGPGLIDARWVEPPRLREFTFSSAGRRLITSLVDGDSSA